MAWPSDMTDGPHLGEMLIDGTWVDVSSRIRGSDTIRIDRGRRDIQGSALMPATTCNFTLNNADGLFTDDNPLSPYFEKLPLFTEFRISMPGASDGYVYMPGHDEANYVSTPDKAALDITGDLDLRIDIAPASWFMPIEDGNVMTLASKSGAAGSQFSWMFGLRSDGKMYFAWSPTGASGAGFAFTSAQLTYSERMALRVTMDVDNGAGGFTIRWYTSDTIDGSWTLIETDTNGGGTTSFFSSSGPVELGSGNGGIAIYDGVHTYSGKIYAFEMRNGIDGSIVAEADFRSQDVGTTSFADGLGNTWTVNNEAVVTSDAIRFWGEIETLPQEWDPSGRDMFSRVHAQDLLARLGMPQQPVTSPIYQNRIPLDPTGYWTFEDGTESTQAAAVSKNTNPATVHEINFKATDDLPGSDGAAQFSSGGAFVRGRARVTSITGTASALIFFKFPAVPASTVTIASFTTTGSAAYWWRIETDGGSFTTRAFDADGVSLLSSATLIGPVDITKWMAIRLELTTSGANINWATAWHEVGDSVFWGGSGTIAGSVGRFTGFTVFGSAANTDMYFSHVWLDTSLVDFVSTEFREASNGYIGETFGARFRRICNDIGVTADIDGWESDTSPVGRQPIDTPLKVLQDGADVDGGFLIGSRRSSNTLTYITRQRVQSQAETVSLSHSSSHLAATPKPVKDSTGVRNDVTVSRRDGSSSRVVVTDGRYGTDAIGSVPAAETYNAANDQQTEDIAGWLASMGSVGEYRFPEITVMQNRSQTLFGSTIGKSVCSVDVGRYVEVTDLPAGQAPGPYEQIVQGYGEIIDNKTWKTTFNGTPYGPWRAGLLDNSSDIVRFAATDTTVDADVTSSATSIAFKTPSTSSRWVVTLDTGIPANTFPMDVMIGGEWIRVTAMTGTAVAGGFYTQTATVERSINGIVKAQTAGTPIQLRRVFRFGR